MIWAILLKFYHLTKEFYDWYSKNKIWECCFYDMIFCDCHKYVSIQQVQEHIMDLFRNNFLHR